MLDLPESLRSLSDPQWLEVLLRSIKSPDVDGFTFPTIRSAYEFFVYAKSRINASGARLANDARFLDFGTGWGRFMRVFWKDFQATNMIGVDVDPTVLSDCQTHGVPGRFLQVDPLGIIDVPDNSVDLVVAYSVFSHLPEDVHLHWLRELHRLMKPGAFFVSTVEPRRFIDFVEKCADNPTNSWAQTLGAFAPRAIEMKRQFDAGEFVYIETGGGAYRPKETYGDAVIPLAYIKRVWGALFRVWGALFEIDDYVDDNRRFVQSVVTCRKPSATL
jgi:ubiquinone/menaquinone biosynthesis C-methylase UbiE